MEHLGYITVETTPPDHGCVDCVAANRYELCRDLRAVAPYEQDRCSACTRHMAPDECGSNEFECTPENTEDDFYWRTEHDAVLLRMGVAP